MDERRTQLGFVAPEPGHEPEPEKAWAAVAPTTKAPAETFSRHFLGISLRRAYRLDIKTDEVLPSERAHLEAQASHIRNPEHQAFLAWRRSVLLMVALMFVPLTISRFIETWHGFQVPGVGRIFTFFPVIAEGLFCIIMFDQLRNWAQWKKQRRVLFIAWGIYFIAPFAMYLFPYREAYDGSAGYYMARAMLNSGALPFKLTAGRWHMMVGVRFGIAALLLLGPKIISLMPGLIRASIVTKLQFPGTTAPGWLMMLAAPLYALFAYIIVLLPYQITGSWQFLAGNAGILLAQIFIARAGRTFTTPMTNEDANHRIHSSWLAYIGIIVVSAGFMVYGVADFIHEMQLGTWSVVSGILTVASNVLLDTLVGTDAIITAMSYLKRQAIPDPAHVQMLNDAEAKLAVFTSQAASRPPGP
jgi:hypothetical protein